ncbi:hypothetical protein Bca52824_003408 [Brassica carinata]|uniref:DAGKc domain-containing protein n=1 Tax=Brassica carinata TaxID=52824 RepID=A0A8X8BF72_BRACI|nr:hypothetical protein Bca52824_003408 [Brassica carinata]
MGAVVEVTCKAGDKTVKAYGKTKINGKYAITVKGYNYRKYGGDVCTAKLHAPPKGSPCNIPTSYHMGNKGAKLHVKSKTKYEVVLYAKSFAYAPKKPYGAVVEVTCKAGDKTVKAYGKTKINGKYAITVKGYNYRKYGGDVCTAKLHAPPKGSPCNIPTSYHLGNKGAKLHVKSKTKYEPENDHLPSPALISDQVLINGVITPLTLTANGELQWTESGRRKSTSEKEILSSVLERNKIRVKTLVERRGGGSTCCGGSGGDYARKYFVFEPLYDESRKLWCDKLRQQLHSLEVACVCEPFGGKKTERKIFLEEGKPLFDDADVQLEIQETKYQLHAKEMVRFMDLSKYDGVILTRRFSTMSIRPMPCFPPIVFSSERRVARESAFPLSVTGSPDSIPISMYLLKVQTTVAEM